MANCCKVRDDVWEAALKQSINMQQVKIFFLSFDVAHNVHVFTINYPPTKHIMG